MKYKNKNNPTKRKKSLLIWGGALLLAGVIIVGVLELTDTINLFKKDKATPTTANQYTKGEQSKGNKNSGSSDEQGSGDNTNSETKGQSDEPVTNDTSDVLSPNGNFVSAHKFSLSDAPVLQSSCETTPKVKCQITFTKGSTVLKLDEKITDDGGAAYWTWKPSDIGLTTGSWKIQAKASNSSKSLTTDDALQLEVTP